MTRKMTSRDLSLSPATGQELWCTISKLINVLEEKGIIIESAFHESPEVYENISDQAVQVSLAGLIYLYNKERDRAFHPPGSIAAFKKYFVN
jgi:hypothetical protein